MPVPAGIRCPMMMFSLSPSKSSLAPLMAASVSTRVVSWNDAAEMNDCVVSDALVIPKSNGSLVAGLLPFFTTRSFLSRKVNRSTASPSRKSVSPGSTTRTFWSIWRTITPMCLSLIFTPWRRYTSWISFTRFSCTARAHPVALVHPQVLGRLHFVQLRLALLRLDEDLALAALDLAELHHPVDFRDGRRILGPSGLEQLGHARGG